MTERAYTAPTTKARMAAAIALADFNADRPEGLWEAVSYRLKNLGGSSKVQAFSVCFLDKLGQTIGTQYLGNFIS